MNREDKINFLKRLEQGKATVDSFPFPITGMEFVHEGKLFYEVQKVNGKHVVIDHENENRNNEKRIDTKGKDKAIKGI